jgi:hypothetical protein
MGIKRSYRDYIRDPYRGANKTMNNPFAHAAQRGIFFPFPPENKFSSDMAKKYPQPFGCGLFLLLRRERDSNPRCPRGAQRFSRPPRSTTPASLLIAAKIVLLGELLTK